MLTLGIETSSRPGTVALLDNKDVVAESVLEKQGHRHTQALIVVIEELLKTHHVDPSDIDLIAVSIGPGSFTGLRVGVVCAKTLAYSLGCSLKGVETFDAIAQQWRHAHLADSGSQNDHLTRLLVIDDAQRGDVFVKEFPSPGEHTEGRRNSKFKECTIASLSSFIDALTDRDVVAGPGLKRYKNEMLQTPVIISEDAYWLPSARSVGQCAIASLKTEPTDDPFQMTPLYIRRSAAEEKRLQAYAGDSKM